MKTFFLILLTLFAVYEILNMFGVFEISNQHRKVATDVERARKSASARKREMIYLNLCSSIAELFRGILLTPSMVANHQYYIARLNLRTKNLGRQYTVDEYRGMKFFPFALSFLLIPAAFVQPLFLLVPIFFGFKFFTYQTKCKLLIQDEDTIIDDYFIDLYLLLYSKLRQGSRARLQGTIQEYIDTLETQASTSVRNTMLNFSKYFLNLLSLYEDHVAVPMLRDTYRSATIINFCNIATQSLNGIDNFDNLLTFKMQLTERKTKLMRARQAAILRSGERSIYAIWIILFIFIAVGWYSKLPLGAL